MAKMKWAHQSSSSCYLKSLQIPGRSGPEEERTAVTILKGEKKGTPGPQQAMPETVKTGKER